MDEFQKALKHYGNASVQHQEVDDVYLNIINNFNKVAFFERPDAYLVQGDTIYIIEHFEFDSAVRTKKGSTSQAEMSRTQRDFEQYDPGNGFYVDELNIEPSLTSYIKNAETNLLNHAGKINSYKNNLLDKGIITPQQKIVIGFFIEDTTHLGNYNKGRDISIGLRPLILTQCPKFIDIFEACKELDFCFCASSSCLNGRPFDNNPKIPILSFISRSTIEQHRMNQLNRIDFIAFPSRMMGLKFLCDNFIHTLL